MGQDRNYVAAWHDYAADKIVVLERDQTGQLFRKRYNPPYYFYVPDEDGEFTSIFGDKLMRAEFDSREQYDYAKRHYPKKFESDITPLKRVLMDYYYGRDAPIVHTALLDIEVDYSSSIGFAGPTNPYAPINAVTVYQSWTGKYLTAVVPPKGWSGSKKTLIAKIEELIASKNLRDGIIPEIFICEDELQLVNLMLSWLEGSDIVSGWNSEFFDLPYICERLLVLGGERLLCKIDHLGVRAPKKEETVRFGKKELTYKLTGRAHLDYMALFKKFTFEGRVSYSLGNILEEEVGVGKLEYDGTLEQLYRNDFETFVAYNFRDVDGIVQLDEKFKFIALANQMSHENTVLFGDVLGTVSYVETGITNHAHNKLNLIVHDKNIKEHDKVEGAIVMTPKIGLHEYVGAVDINSLYPNTIRALNISPEKIVGQFTAKEEAWRDIKEGNFNRHTLIFEDGHQEIASAKEWKDALALLKFAISAYGTVFDQSSGNGVVADILGFWYAERKRLQAEKKKWELEVKALKLKAVIKIPHNQVSAIRKKTKTESNYDTLSFQQL